MAFLFRRTLTTKVPGLNLAGRAAIPKPRGPIATPTDFLSSLKRNLQSHSEKLPQSWDDLFKLKGPDLKEAGLPVRDRRYLLFALERYRQGQDPEAFAQAVRRKKYRGWGPRIQRGKRVR